jgi:hypothetical protein
MFHLFQTHVASVLSGCCICCNGYVANVCSKCFICFGRMLQSFHLSVAKVDLDVELLNEEERASVGAMAALMWGGDTGRAMPVWKRRGSHSSGVEEAGAKWCGRGRRGASVEEAGEVLVWKRRGRVSVGSRAEGSGLNTGTRCGAGAGGARIREMWMEQARVTGRAQPPKHPGASLSAMFRYLNSVWVSL